MSNYKNNNIYNKYIYWIIKIKGYQNYNINIFVYTKAAVCFETKR